MILMIITEKECKMRYKSQHLDSFIAAYFRNLPKFDSYPEAYEAAESDYTAKFGHRKYKNWQTFQVILHRYRKNT